MLLKYLNRMLAILSVACLFSLTGYTQGNTGTLYGKIVTSDGFPAEYISVMLDATKYGTTSNSQGQFELKAPEGNYTLVVFSIVCHKQEIPITIKAGQTTQVPNITIIENKTQLGEIVVTGQFRPQSLQKSVYKMRVIGQQQIESKGATNVQNLLNTEVGIRLSNDMALGETDFELMGMSGNNIKVLIDGVPMIDRLTKKQSLSQIDVNTIERVEIVEGPMSVVYGSDALAGVINIITKKKTAEAEKKWKIAARFQEETVGNEYQPFFGKGIHNQNVSANYSLKNGLFAGGSFTHNGFGGWQGNYAGRAKQWQPKEQYIMGGQLGIKKDKISAWYRLDYLAENLLTEIDINTVTNKTSDKEFIVDRYTHQLQSEWKASDKLQLSAAGSYQFYNRRTRTTNIDLNTGKKTLSLDEGVQDETNFSLIFGRFTGVWSLAKNLTLQPGIEFQSTQGIGDRINGEQQIENTAVFLSAEYSPWAWLNIRPGIRSNFNSVFNAPKAVPSLNTKFNLNEAFDLRLSYGRGYRAPTLQELFYSFHDSNHNINGNPNLEAEHSNSYMGSLVWRSVHKQNFRLTNTISGFYNDFRNRISLIESSEIAGYYHYYNIDRYKTTGFTLENTLSTQSLKANVNFSYVGRYNSLYESEDYGDAEMSPFRFSPELSANISYELQKIATINLFYKFTGKRHEYMIDSNNQIALQGLNSYHWADLTLTRKFAKHLSANLGVRNLFNITEVSSTATSSSSGHGTSSGGNQLGCGRSYFAGIAFNLQ
jgi:outer membrane receptor for ferrienterochelin and colicins